MSYLTIVRIWSKSNGLLRKVEIQCTGPDDAFEKVAELKAQTFGGYACHYYMPEYPNHNLKERYCHYG
jgi:hypothetical protein